MHHYRSLSVLLIAQFAVSSFDNQGSFLCDFYCTLKYIESIYSLGLINSGDCLLNLF